MVLGLYQRSCTFHRHELTFAHFFDLEAIFWFVSLAVLDNLNKTQLSTSNKFKMKGDGTVVKSLKSRQRYFFREKLSIDEYLSERILIEI